MYKSLITIIYDNEGNIVDISKTNKGKDIISILDLCALKDKKYKQKLTYRFSENFLKISLYEEKKVIADYILCLDKKCRKF